MKSILVAYLLWLLGGPLGLYKFYLGRPFMGLLYIFTCGGFFLGWISRFFHLTTPGPDGQFFAAAPA